MVSPGQKIKIEKLASPKGEELKTEDEIELSEVLLREKDDKLEIGNPLIEGAKVIGKIIETKKDKKVIVFRYKSKTRRHKKKGHRQWFNRVEILRIL